jgi:hypothetical protein
LRQEEAHQLIAESDAGGHMSGISSVPVMIHVRASHFFSLNSKAQRCLIYIKWIKCSHAILEVQKQNAESSNSVNIFHQDIRGLRTKRDE